MTWKTTKKILAFAVALSIATGFAHAADVRVVIDVSGSMKQNDPENLRIPAVKVLAKLLPSDASAGIWTFGQHVNMLVKHGQANAVWKENAQIRSDNINSVALRTNIGEALERVTWDISLNNKTDRHIILLTDGQIDVSEDPQVNQASRQQILQEQLPALVAAGFQVHTLALSEQADRQFLRQLSLATNGYHGLVANPEALAEYFLKILDVAAPAIEVPITSEDGFVIDDAVDEFTVLMFRNPGAKNKLIDPAGRIVDVTHRLTGMRWFEDPTFDLVTLQRPSPGRWRVVGGGANDRVTVVSNLKLVAEPLSSTIYPGFTADWQVYLADGEEIITDPNLLGLVNFAAQVDSDRQSLSLLVSPSGESPADGVYLVKISSLDHPGEYQFNITASSPTFERHTRRVSVLRDPVSLTTKTVTDNAEVWVDIVDANIDYQSLRVVARVRRDRQPQQVRPLQQGSHGNWVLSLGSSPGKYEIALNIKGNYLNGNDFNLSPSPLEVALPLAGEQQIGLSMQGVAVQRVALPRVALPRVAMKREPANSLLEPQEEVSSVELPEADVTAVIPDANPDAGQEPEVALEKELTWLMIAIIALINLFGFVAVWWFFIRSKGTQEHSFEFDNALSNVTLLVANTASARAAAGDTAAIEETPPSEAAITTPAKLESPADTDEQAKPAA